MMNAATLPALPARAAYLNLSNPTRRNALSLAVLRSLRAQLIAANTSPTSDKLRLLPPFKPQILHDLELAAGRPPSYPSYSTITTTPDAARIAKAKEDYSWLLSSSAWHTERASLPTLLVLRTPGPIFCSGHDLAELSSLPPSEVRETFALCAEVMSLIRRSPAPVIGVIQGLATAAGAQLALTVDVALAAESAVFRLPGAGLGLPCTSPATAVVRRVGVARTARMLATADAVSVKDMGGAVEVVHAKSGEETAGALERRIQEVVGKMVGLAAQPQALGKWAFWTQVGLDGVVGVDGATGGGRGGDGYEDAVEWTGRMMVLHARGEDAKEGMGSFFEKRAPAWKT